ncbi:hypothetical protein SKAU_G00008720 [Synaphobranchus kaupii]|uniref:Uncharacterized protein n=1 Tax=Synaphobranchus kaupii TaxID=118154 RepID=A0A9Q1GAS9_SYNKA|nr:hypothetical protein SKAU_G00008720 [Synaphobranchus kaupii]
MHNARRRETATYRRDTHPELGPTSPAQLPGATEWAGGIKSLSVPQGTHSAAAMMRGSLPRKFYSASPSRWALVSRTDRQGMPEQREGNILNDAYLRCDFTL